MRCLFVNISIGVLVLFIKFPDMQIDGVELVFRSDNDLQCTSIMLLIKQLIHIYNISLLILCHFELNTFSIGSSRGLKIKNLFYIVHVFYEAFYIRLNVVGFLVAGLFIYEHKRLFINFYDF